MAEQMKPGFLAPAGALDGKPLHGAPCNRCGLCCVATLCPLGAKLFGRERGPCPALVKAADGLYGCGVVARPGDYAPGATFVNGVEAMRAAALRLIGAARGCDARFNGEPINRKFHAHLERLDRSTRSIANAARRLWGLR